jgi:uncharacterized protein
MSVQSVVEKTEAIVRDRMSGQAAGHGMDHVLRVLTSARAIQAEVGGDLVTVALAALSDDIGGAKFLGGVERSAEFAREIFGDLEAADDVIEHVAHIVDSISFGRTETAEPLSLEARWFKTLTAWMLSVRLGSCGRLSMVPRTQVEFMCNRSILRTLVTRRLE